MISPASPNHAGRPYDPWIPLAAARARVWLKDGTEAALVGIPRRSGPRARVEFPGGRRVTVALTEIVAVEQTLDGVA